MSDPFGVGHDSSACSSHGECYDTDKCSCDEGFVGKNCNEILYECGTVAGYDGTPRNWWKNMKCLKLDE